MAKPLAQESSRSGSSHPRTRSARAPLSRLVANAPRPRRTVGCQLRLRSFRATPRSRRRYGLPETRMRIAFGATARTPLACAHKTAWRIHFQDCKSLLGSQAFTIAYKRVGLATDVGNHLYNRASSTKRKGSAATFVAKTRCSARYDFANAR
jgi:hypothetical protein